MINHIILPTDFSASANIALDYAILLAKKTNSKLTILHVNQTALVDASMPTESYQLFVNEIENFVEEGFALIKSKLSTSGINCTYESKYGFIADEICDFSDNAQADLIIMGTTGTTGLGEVLIGSNCASVIGRSKIPCLAIPENANVKEFEKIIYATDYNEPEFPAFSRLLYFAELFNAEVDIVHVESENDHYFNSENNFFKKNKNNINYNKIKYTNLPKGKTAEVINLYIDQNQADLLVLAKHNRNFFDRLMHRSLSKKMAYHIHLPLLILVK